MDFTLSIGPFLFIVGLFLWNLSGALHLYRLASYFQLEGYDNKRFLRWIWQARERRYLLIVLISTVVLVLTNAYRYFIIYDPAVPNPGPETANSIQAARAQELFSAALMTIGIALFDLLVRPRDSQIKQRFVTTQRAIRLIVTAFVIPVFLFGYHLFALIEANFEPTIYRATLLS